MIILEFHHRVIPNVIFASLTRHKRDDVLSFNFKTVHKMKFGVIVFPGSNCDRDMLHVLGNVVGAEIKAVFHKETSLAGF
jgi:hypothetical protein